MSDQESDQMMALLQELSVLKELDAQFEANPTAFEREAYQARQERQRAIKLEMVALAEQKKHVDHEPTAHE